jgi:hypothetical protein
MEELKTLKERDKMLEELWNELEDVPMNPETECIEEDFYIFPAGTDREDIWHYFDERHSKGVAYLLYGDSVERTDETAQLLYKKQLCFECDSENCIFNPEGKCLYPLLYGKKPEDTFNGCSGWIELN